MTSHQLPLPPAPSTASGALRRVGVELEFGGLALDAVVGIVSDFVGGEPEARGRYEQAVAGDPAGPWEIERDFAWLKELGRRTRDPNDPLSGLEEAGEELVRVASELLVPVEVVSPPLPMDRLGEVDTLIERLRRAGAVGTSGGVAYAFGLQINPELPDTGTDTLLGYFKAFLCLFDWLHKQAKVDLTRRLTPFIAPFPRAYVRRVVDPSYHPDLARLIDDYLADNPTRNRALDLLPVFLHLDEGRVRRVITDPRVKARPALHYRLPNCEIDHPGWGLAPLWADWLQVERLAARPERLREVCRAYAQFLDRPLGGLMDDWAEEVTRWIEPSSDH